MEMKCGERQGRDVERTAIGVYGKDEIALRRKIKTTFAKDTSLSKALL
jgi:hypothetical protein